MGQLLFRGWTWIILCLERILLFLLCRSLSVWELDSFTQAYSLPKHSNKTVLDAAALQDGWLAISAGEEGQVKIWDLLTRPISISPAHSGHVTCTRFSVCGSLVASGGHDGVVLVHTFMVGSRKFEKALTLSGPVSGLAPFRDNKRLASSSLNGPVCIWDADTSGDVLQLRGKEGEQAAFTSVSVSWSSDYVAAGDVCGQVTVWESESGRRLKTLRDHSQAVMAVAFCESSANQLLVSGDAESILCIRNLHDASFIQTIHLDVVGGVTCLRPQPGGSNIVTASSQDPTVSLWSLPDGHLLSTIDCCSSGVNDVAVFSVKGTLHLLAACSDHTLRLWEVTEEEKSLKAILPTDHFPHCCDVGSDGESILAVYGDSQGNVATTEICFEGVPESFKEHLDSLQHLHTHATPHRKMEGMDQDALSSQNEEEDYLGQQSSTEASSPLAMHLAPAHSETEKDCHHDSLHADTSHPALLVAPEKGSPPASHSGGGSGERETEDSSLADGSCWNSDKHSHFDFEVEIGVDRDVNPKAGEQVVQSKVLDSPAKNGSAASVAKATVLSKSEDKHLQEQQTASSVCTLL